MGIDSRLLIVLGAGRGGGGDGDYLWEAINRGTAIIRGSTVYRRSKIKPSCGHLKKSLTEPQEAKSKTFNDIELPGVLGKDCTKKRQLNKNE